MEARFAFPVGDCCCEPASLTNFPGILGYGKHCGEAGVILFSDLLGVDRRTNYILVPETGDCDEEKDAHWRLGKHIVRTDLPNSSLLMGYNYIWWRLAPNQYLFTRRPSSGTVWAAGPLQLLDVKEDVLDILYEDGLYHLVAIDASNNTGLLLLGEDSPNHGLYRVTPEGLTDAVWQPLPEIWPEIPVDKRFTQNFNQFTISIDPRTIHEIRVDAERVEDGTWRSLETAPLFCVSGDVYFSIPYRTIYSQERAGFSVDIASCWFDLRNGATMVSRTHGLPATRHQIVPDGEDTYILDADHLAYDGLICYSLGPVYWLNGRGELNCFAIRHKKKEFKYVHQGPNHPDGTPSPVVIARYILSQDTVTLNGRDLDMPIFGDFKVYGYGQFNEAAVTTDYGAKKLIIYCSHPYSPPGGSPGRGYNVRYYLEPYDEAAVPKYSCSLQFYYLPYETAAGRYCLVSRNAPVSNGSLPPYWDPLIGIVDEENYIAGWCYDSGRSSSYNGPPGVEGHQFYPADQGFPPAPRALGGNLIYGNLYYVPGNSFNRTAYDSVVGETVQVSEAEHNAPGFCRSSIQVPSRPSSLNNISEQVGFSGIAIDTNFSDEGDRKLFHHRLGFQKRMRFVA